MGCFGNSDDQEEQQRSHNPKYRTCTDVFWLGLYIVFWLFLVSIFLLYRHLTNTIFKFQIIKNYYLKVNIKIKFEFELFRCVNLTLR